MMPDHNHPFMIVVKCHYCQSTNVAGDALVSWDTDSQAWIRPSGVLDSGSCLDCGGMTLVQRRLDNDDPVTEYDRFEGEETKPENDRK